MCEELETATIQFSEHGPKIYAISPFNRSATQMKVELHVLLFHYHSVLIRNANVSVYAAADDKPHGVAGAYF